MGRGWQFDHVGVADVAGALEWTFDSRRRSAVAKGKPAVIESLLRAKFRTACRNRQHTNDDSVNFQTDEALQSV